MLTEKRKQVLTDYIMGILRHNGLSPREIEELFRADRPMGDNAKVHLAADQITALFITEKLSITEGSVVLKAVSDAFAPKEKRRV